ncbi:MAG: adenylate/guanylate cyclase domain-containing protein [Acidimicrobiales bacterium]
MQGQGGGDARSEAPGAWENLSQRDLARYVPRAAVEWDTHGAENWQLIDGSLLFVDISGFTKLSERLTVFGRIGAEELTDVLDRVFGDMLDLGYARAGSLLKFGGDALLFMFTEGAHAQQACSAAVEMRAALRSASQMATSVGRLQLKMSVGVHSGVIHLFRVGRTHTEFLVAGPAASATTDMEKVAEAGEIVVSSATRALLPSGAAPTPKGAGWLLRSRGAIATRPGPVLRNAIEPATVFRFVPAVLRDHLSAGDAEPEHRIASVGFIRFKGVDTLLATAGPERTCAALNELVVCVQEAAMAEGVTFLASDIDHDGGKLILSTGVPAAQEDDEGRMLRTMRRIVEASPELPLQIGVNRGHVYAGEIGTAYRCAYTVMGDTVNLAARLMAAAPVGAIYTMPGVLDAAHTLFDVTALEPLQVKGKSEPLLAYAVGAETSSRDPETQGALPFTGRAQELIALRGLLQAAVDGDAAIVTVTGGTGVGKSRLVSEALQTGPQIAKFTLSAEPYGVADAYRAFRHPLRRLLGITSLDRSEMAAELAATVRAVDSGLLPFLPLIADVVHLAVPTTPEVDAIEPRFWKQRLADVVDRLLQGLVPQPAVIVVDDGHWLDEASADLLAALVAGDGRWSMVMTRREQPGGLVASGGSTIALGPLTNVETASLVLAATAAAPLRPDDVATVVDRADGHPLYVQEIVRAARLAGGFDALPESLDATVAAQIDRLAPLLRRVLRFAAVLGRTFPLSVLSELLAVERLEIDDAMSAELAEFLERDGSRDLRFRHALLQEVAYEGLSYRRRRELHALAGEAIERLNAADPDRAADVLGLHFARAHWHAKAWRYARVAGDVARRAHANAPAAVHYERALAAGRRLPDVTDRERAEVWTVLGDVREQAGRFDLALDAYKRASRLVASDPVATADMLLKRARARERAGAFSVALREISVGLRQIASMEAAAHLQARLLAFRAVVRQGQGRPADALAVARAAAEVAQAAGEAEALARAYSVMDWAYLSLGQPDQAQMGELSLRLYLELGDLEGQGKVMNTMGASAYFRGDWDEAVRWYNGAREIGLRTGNHVQAAISGMNLGEILVNQGRFDDAEPMLLDSIRIFRATGYPDGKALAETYLGRLLLARGDMEAAVHCLDDARQAFESIGIPGGALEATIPLAECHVRFGDPATALRLIDEALRRAGGEAGVLAPNIARVRAAAMVQAGELTQAHEQIAAGLDSARRQQLRYEEGLLLDLRDEIVVSDSASAAAPPLYLQ